jgi:hypothetical protein
LRESSRDQAEGAAAFSGRRWDAAAFSSTNKSERLGTKKVAAMDEHHQKRNLIPLKTALTKGGFGKTKAYELIDQEKIIAYKMGGKTMIDADSIDNYHLTLSRILPVSRKQTPRRRTRSRR